MPYDKLVNQLPNQLCFFVNKGHILISGILFYDFTTQVLPFYASSLTEEEEKDVAAAVQEPPSEQLAEVTTVIIQKNALGTIKFVDFPQGC